MHLRYTLQKNRCLIQCNLFHKMTPRRSIVICIREKLIDVKMFTSVRPNYLFSLSTWEIRNFLREELIICFSNLTSGFQRTPEMTSLNIEIKLLLEYLSHVTYGEASREIILIMDVFGQNKSQCKK